MNMIFNKASLLSCSRFYNFNAYFVNHDLIERKLKISNHIVCTYRRYNAIINYSRFNYFQIHHRY